MTTSRSSWLRWILLVEGLILLLVVAYMGRSRYERVTGGEGNRIARLFLDDPTWLQSFLFLFLATHVILGLLLFIAWLSAKRRGMHSSDRR